MIQTSNEPKGLIEQARLLDKVLEETYQLIQEERDKGPELTQKLEKDLDEAHLNFEKLGKKISRAKTQIKKRKLEIDEWKEWYNALEQHDKTSELQQLNEEIKWRADEIANKEKEITELNLQLLDAEGQCEHLKIRLQALREVDQSLPIDKDPRILDLLEEKSLVNKQLEAV